MCALEASVENTISKAANDLRHGDAHAFRNDLQILRADPSYHAHRQEEMKALGDALEKNGLLPKLSIGNDEHIVGVSKNGHVLTSKDGSSGLQWHNAANGHSEAAATASRGASAFHSQIAPHVAPNDTRGSLAAKESHGPAHLSSPVLPVDRHMLDSVSSALKVDDETWGGHLLHKDGANILAADVLGGAIAGGVVAGPMGALAGAAVGTIAAVATEGVLYGADKFEKYVL